MVDMRNIAALLCMLLILALGPAAFAANVTVAVKSEAKIQGSHLSLGDIAEVSGEDPGRVRELKALSLGDAPAPGTTWYMTPATLEPKLAATQADFSQITWSVPPEFRITTLSQRVSGQRISEVALSHLKRVSLDASLSLVSMPVDMQVPEGTLELSADLSGPIRYNMPTIVQVSVKTNGMVFTRIPVQFEVKRYLDVVVATLSMNAGDTVSAQSVKLEKMNVGALPSGYMTDLNKVIGLQLRYAVIPGTVLGERTLMRPMLVRRGESIRLLARVGTLEVSALGVALSGGAMGELIRVQNSTTKKIMNGYVQDDKSVLVMDQQGG